MFTSPIAFSSYWLKVHKTGRTKNISRSKKIYKIASTRIYIYISRKIKYKVNNLLIPPADVTIIQSRNFQNQAKVSMKKCINEESKGRKENSDIERTWVSDMGHRIVS